MTTNPKSDVHSALAALLHKYVKLTQQQTGANPKVSLDSPLADRNESPAIIRNDGTCIEWMPAPHDNLALFTDLENGLGTPVHVDIKQFYGAFWSEGICCQSETGPIQLIQVWNQTDLEMLRENLLGHAFMKSKKRQPLTLFFGVADGENMLTVDNATGQVFMEVAGRRPHLTLAANLATYLHSLEITLESYGLN